MRIWGIEEASAHPPIAVAVAIVWTPARWREARHIAWVAHSDEALRSLFPTLPETIEGPWGSLSRSKVLGPEEAGSAMLDAICGVSMTEGGAIDPAMEHAEYSMTSEALSDRVDSGKLTLGGGLGAEAFSMDSQAVSAQINLPASFYKEEKRVALAKIDRLVDGLDARMREWMPGLVRLADPAKLSLLDVQACLAKGRALELARAVPMAERSRLAGAGRI